MIWIVRIGLVVAWGWILQSAIGAALNSDTLAGASVAGYFGMLIMVGIPLAAVWIPVFGRIVVGKAVEAVSDDHYTHSGNWLALAIDRAVERGERKKVVFLCWLETWINPKLTRPNSIGLTHAVPGSRLELQFARRLFRGNTASECIRAADVIERHGFSVGMHNSDTISQLLLQRKKLRQQERRRLKEERLQAAEAAEAEEGDSDDDTGLDPQDPPA